MEPISGSIIVLAQCFNPSIVSERWLVDREVAAEDEFGDTAVRTPQAAQHRIGAVELLVVQDRLQAMFNPGDLDAVARACALVQHITHELPHTPYRALGTNFQYGIRMREEAFPGVVRRMFLSDDCPLAEGFSAPDAHFGGYFSTDVDGFRLKLDVKPVSVNVDEGTVPGLRFAFNFHRDIGDGDSMDAIRQIKESLDATPRCREFAVGMVAAVESAAGDAVLPT